MTVDPDDERIIGSGEEFSHVVISPSCQMVNIDSTDVDDEIKSCGDMVYVPIKTEAPGKKNTQNFIGLAFLFPLSFWDLQRSSDLQLCYSFRHTFITHNWIMKTFLTETLWFVCNFHPINFQIVLIWLLQRLVLIMSALSMLPVKRALLMSQLMFTQAVSKKYYLASTTNRCWRSYGWSNCLYKACSKQH